MSRSFLAEAEKAVRIRRKAFECLSRGFQKKIKLFQIIPKVKASDSGASNCSDNKPSEKGNYETENWGGGGFRLQNFSKC